MHTLLTLWALASQTERAEFLRTIRRKPKPPAPDALNAIIQEAERAAIKQARKRK